MKIFKILLFTLIFSSLFAEKNYKIINSDRLSIEKKDGDYISHLNGNVKFIYDGIKFNSDYAEIFENKRIATLANNVKIVEDTITINSDRATYFSKDKRLYFSGNVIITQLNKTSKKKTTYCANEIDYYREDKHFYANKDVSYYDENRNITATCGYMIYNFTTGYGYMIENPIVNSYENDTFTIKAEKMELLKSGEKLLASYNVETYNIDNHTKSKFLLYLKDEGKIILYGEPKFYSKKVEGHANKFYVYLKDNNVDRIVMEDSCMINFSDSDTLQKNNWLSGDYVEMFYKNDKMNSCIVTPNSESFYVNKDKNDNTSINLVKSKYLEIKFNEMQKIKSIFIKDDVKGVYRF